MRMCVCVCVCVCMRVSVCVCVCVCDRKTERPELYSQLSVEFHALAGGFELVKISVCSPSPSGAPFVVVPTKPESFKRGLCCFNASQPLSSTICFDYFCCNLQRTEVQVARTHTIRLRAKLPNGVRSLRRGKGDGDGVDRARISRRRMSRGSQIKIVDSHCGPREQMLLEKEIGIHPGENTDCSPRKQMLLEKEIGIHPDENTDPKQDPVARS